MQKIILNGKEISYTLEYKNVKNINLRIKPDGTVYVSANKRVPKGVIEDFMGSKSDFILNALDKFKFRAEVKPDPFFSDEEIRDVVRGLCERVYPYFEKRGVKYPQIKFRRMVSCWGSCRSQKGILTFNTALMFAPIECIEYVVLHEFTHFLQANHSKKFYEELEKVMPDWRIYRQKLREINIR